MRLTCPNCSAQYEVDERVIPANGRDVQCSACGNTWYQYPLEVAFQMRAAELEDDDDDEDDTPTPADRERRSAAPRIDKTVLSVLREEAERELSERKRAQGASQSGLQTQGDLGLTRPTRSKAAPSRVYGEDDPERPAPPPLPDYDTAATPTEPVRRRNLLPDIEELTSTLEPGHESRPGRDASNSTSPQSAKGGFGSGVSIVLLVAMFLFAIYMLTPLISAYVPFLSGVLRSYVSLVDAMRAAIAGQLRGVFGG